MGIPGRKELQEVPSCFAFEDVTLTFAKAVSMVHGSLVEGQLVEGQSPENKN